MNWDWDWGAERRGGQAPARDDAAATAAVPECASVRVRQGAVVYACVGDGRGRTPDAAPPFFPLPPSIMRPAPLRAALFLCGRAACCRPPPLPKLAEGAAATAAATAAVAAASTKPSAGMVHRTDSDHILAEVLVGKAGAGRDVLITKMRCAGCLRSARAPCAAAGRHGTAQRSSRWWYCIGLPMKPDYCRCFRRRGADSPDVWRHDKFHERERERERACLAPKSIKKNETKGGSVNSKSV